MNQEQFDTFVQAHEDSLRVITAANLAEDLGLSFYPDDYLPDEAV